jgi:hypothetical protein
MMYNLNAHIQELLNDAEKCSIVTNYEKYYGSIPCYVQHLQVHREYLSKFDLGDIPLNLPKGLERDFNYKLLLRLGLASFSTEVNFELSGSNNIEVLFTVKTDDAQITKRLSELWGFQILRLFQVFVEEQINMEVLAASDAEEMTTIYVQRANKLREFEQLAEKVKMLQFLSVFSDSISDEDTLDQIDNPRDDNSVSIDIPEDLYKAIQMLKTVFFQLTGKEVQDNSEVLSILIGGFIDSMSANGEFNHNNDEN